MNCPTKEQVLKASYTSREAKAALMELFPAYFAVTLKAGQMYVWGTDADGGSGIVFEHPANDGFMFANFINGKVYIPYLAKESTSTDLLHEIDKIYKREENRRASGEKIHVGCFPGYTGKGIKGPRSFKSWCTT
jgi:hypothetical protein